MTGSVSVLVVSTDGSLRESLGELLPRKEFEVQWQGDGAAAAEALKSGNIDVILCDLDLPGTGGLELLRHARELSPRTLAFAVGSSASPEGVLEAMRLGVLDYRTKPVSACAVSQAIVDLIAHRQHAEEIQYLRRRVTREPDFSGIIGRSKALRDVLEVVKKVAPTAATVLITGASGSGKELIARAIHAHSDRSDKLFLPVNCGALPETLLESLLFGHMKGSFTGAFANQEGLFERARGGTIFLDEIGEIPAHLQVKLLRALEAKEILPIGSTSPKRIDVRVLAATNRHLEKEVAEGRFRDDLYFRLNIMEICIPSLRDRPEDIPLLVEHLIRKHNPELKRNFKGAEAAVIQLFMSFPWKGNVRELDNVIEHAMILADGDWITLQDLPAALVKDHEGLAPSPQTLREALRLFEKQHIMQVLEQTGQDRKEAARVLDISLSSLYRKIEELGIS